MDVILNNHLRLVLTCKIIFLSSFFLYSSYSRIFFVSGHKIYIFLFGCLQFVQYTISLVLIIPNYLLLFISYLWFYFSFLLLLKDNICLYFAVRNVDWVSIWNVSKLGGSWGTSYWWSPGAENHMLESLFEWIWWHLVCCTMNVSIIKF